MPQARHPSKALPRPDFADVPLARRNNLAAVKGKNTKPELLVRRSLHALDYRFRLHDRRLPGCPDLVFPGRRAIIEVRGCFWHHHGCSNSVLPKTRAEWWAAKLAGNVARDEANAVALASAGWRLAIVWECEVRQDLPEAIEQLRNFLGEPGRGWHKAPQQYARHTTSQNREILGILQIPAGEVDEEG